MMNDEKMAKLRMHLEGALACLDEYGDQENGTAPEHPSKETVSDDVTGKSLKMRLMKYKG